MTTTADLNIKVPTGDIDKAVNSLDALALKAKETALQTAKVTKERTSATVAMARAGQIEASAALRAVQANKASTSAAIAASKSTAEGARAAYDAARATDAKAAATMRAAKADLEATSASRSAAAANDNQAQSARQLGMTTGVQTAHMTNMAAQFQDIGVTAAMGMNPMMIALQQGTQMSLVMSDAVGRGGLAGAFGILGQGLLQILSPISLLIIGFVGLVAYLVQSVDWIKILQSVLSYLADNMQSIIRWSLAVGAAMLVAFAPSIWAGTLAFFAAVNSAIVSLIVKMLVLAAVNPWVAFVLFTVAAIAVVVLFEDQISAIASWIGNNLPTALAVAAAGVLVFRSAILQAAGAMWAFAAANPFVAIILAIGLTIAAVVYFRDAIAEMLGKEVVKIILDTGDKIVAVFVGAWNIVKALWDNFPEYFGDLFYSGMNLAINAMNMFSQRLSGFASATKSVLGALFGPLGAVFGDVITSGSQIDPIANPYEGTIEGIRGVGIASYDAAISTGYFTKAMMEADEKLSQWGKYGSDFLNGWAGDLGMTTDKDGKPKKPTKPKSEKDAITQAEKFADMMTDADNTIKQLTREGAAVGKVGYEYKRAAAMNDLLTQAESKNINLGKEHIKMLQSKADVIARQQQENEMNTQYWNDLRGMVEEKDIYIQEIAMLGLRGDAAVRAAMDYKFLNDELYRGKKYSDDQKATLIAVAIQKDAAKTASETAVSYKQQSEAMKIAQGEALLYRDAIRMGAGASAEAETALKLHNDELYRGKEYSEAMKNSLIVNAGYTARLNEQNKVLAGNMKTVQDTTKGAFRDMFDGLREGETVWQAFGNTVLNVLNKIIDRIMDVSLDAVFKQDGQGGGFLNSVTGFFSKLLSGGGSGMNGAISNAFNSYNGSSAVSSSFAAAFPSAKGNVFQAGQATKFAAGGAFTNGIVSRPTTFDMGLMGEAGPEAIMPLKRGPDGSLGVQMNGNARTSPESVEVNITNHHTLTGAVSSRDIVESNRAMAEQTMEQVRQNVGSWIREEQRNGTA